MHPSISNYTMSSAAWPYGTVKSFWLVLLGCDVGCESPTLFRDDSIPECCNAALENFARLVKYGEGQRDDFCDDPRKWNRLRFLLNLDEGLLKDSLDEAKASSRSPIRDLWADLLKDKRLVYCSGDRKDIFLSSRCAAACNFNAENDFLVSLSAQCIRAACFFCLFETLSSVRIRQRLKSIIK